MLCPSCELSVSSVRPAQCCPCPGPQLSAAVRCPQSAAARLAPSCPPASREARAGCLSVDRGPLSVRTAVRLRSCVRCVSVSAWSGVRRAARLYSRVRTHSRADTASGGRPHSCPPPASAFTAAADTLYSVRSTLAPVSALRRCTAQHCTARHSAQRHWHRLTARHSTALHYTTRLHGTAPHYTTQHSVSGPAVPALTQLCARSAGCADESAA